MIPCELIKDILPLYVDKSLSEEGMQAVKEHLNECPDCKEYLKEIRLSNLKESKTSVEKECAELVGDLKKKYSSIKSKINQKRKLFLICSIAGIATGIAINTIINLLDSKD